MELKRVGGLLVACLLVASMAAACSSSKKSSVSAGAAQKTTTTAATSSTSSDSGSSGSSGSNGSNGGLAGALSTSDCAQAGVAYIKMLSSAEAAITGNKTDASELQTEYDALGGKIPSSLKSEYKTVGDAYAKFAEDVKGASLADPSSYTKAAADLDGANVKAASDKIQAYFDNHCQS